MCGDERGAVIDLPGKYLDEGFLEGFGIDVAMALKKEFACRDLDDSTKPDRWVIVQCQAGCDYAQRRPGPLPFHLGRLVSDGMRGSDKGPMALWKSPCFAYKKESCFLHVSARFSLSLTRENVKEMKPLFRLREQLLNDMIHTISSYRSRLGLIALR